ncbi:MAG TPA: hypothetical protein PLV05_00860 [Verrucomicrobiota bacterium]|nr:hypothetical protein [Verrucomicrobiota bacterium]HRZ68202.1 hypothetical protein [Candidatus Paceibacterota bacterium]HNR70316.1 hypothetical protein [Verrucomicrobiota bacterium]HOQ55727.1 hypothetical protein [Verrucomicrobiota bacterium]HOW78200.1 hypothetical protein [Verrucomicrobiota bacterium]
MPIQRSGSEWRAAAFTTLQPLMAIAPDAARLGRSWSRFIIG